MTEVRWEQYPLVAQYELARKFLQRQTYLQLAPTTIDAYGRSLNDYLGFCARQTVQPEAITRDQVALYVQDLASRPNPKGAKILIEQQLRQDNPVGRGHYVPGRAFGGVRDRGLLPRYHKLPWIPSDPEWLQILLQFRNERLRNQVMLLLAYDGALRREELVRLEISDFDFAYRQIRVCADHAKNSRERVVGYSKMTSRLLEAYLEHRRTLSEKRGPLFLSESHRNATHPLALVTWSKLVQKIAQQTNLPRLTTHTPRHLRLTHMARSHMDLHQIALYAGHASIQTSMTYIHLSGVELTEAVSRSLATFERWIEMSLSENQP